MNITIEDVPDKKVWKIWEYDDQYKTHIGTVSYTMGGEFLIHTVKEMKERWTSETKNLLHNNLVLMDNSVVYSDGPIPYIEIK